MSNRRLLLLDSNSAALEGLRSLLAADPKLDVVGEAGDWWTAIRLAAESQPEVCIMDVSRESIDGVVATRRLRQVKPDIMVIALAEDHDLFRLERLLRAGINAYLLKRRAGTELIPAVYSVLSTGVYLGGPRSHGDMPAATQETVG